MICPHCGKFIEKNPRGCPKSDTIKEIEKLLLGGMHQRDVAKQLKASYTRVRAIRCKLNLPNEKYKSLRRKEVERLLLEGTLRQSEIARKVGLSRQRIEQIGLQLEGYTSPGYALGDESYLSILTEEIVISARDAYTKGVSLSELAKKYEVGRNTLYCALVGKSWAHVPGMLEDSQIRSEILKGDQTHNSIVTKKDVLEIRKLYKDKIYNQKQLAELYGISRMTISSIICGKTWKHVESSLPHEPKRRLTTVKIRHIRELAASGMSYAEIARNYGQSSTNIAAIVQRKIWKDVK